MAKEVYTGGLFSEKRKVFVSPENESGHSLAFAGHLVLLSTSLGLLFKPLEKVRNIVRNFGAVVANTVAMYHPDDQKNYQVLFLIFMLFWILCKSFYLNHFRKLSTT